MKYEPRPHQIPMHAHLRRLRKCALHAGCGTGKTVVVATHILESLEDRFDSQRWLIVGPKLVAEDVWSREFAKWDHLRHIEPRLITAADIGLRKPTPEEVAATDDGALRLVDKRATQQRLLSLQSPVHVTSYNTFPWLVKSLGAKLPYDGIVYDESTFLKFHDSERSRAAKWIARKVPRVQQVIELSGTPVPRGYEDMMTQFYLLDGGERLGATLKDFRENWQEPDARDKRTSQVFTWKLRAGKLEPIQAKIRELAQSAEMDIGVEFVESDVYVKLPPKARAAYAAMREKLLATVDGQVILSANAAVLVGKLRQICNGTLYDNDGAPVALHDAKIAAIKEAVEAETGPVLLAYAFAPERGAIRKAFGRTVVFPDEPGALSAFRAGKFKVLACHPSSLSHGVDGLQDVSNTVFWLGAVHSWDHYQQLNKRLHRSGQKAGAVYVRRFLAADTIEDGIIRNCLLPRGESNTGLLAAIRG